MNVSPDPEDGRLKPVPDENTRSEHGEIETDPDKMDSIRRDRSDDVPPSKSDEPGEPDTPDNPDNPPPAQSAKPDPARPDAAKGDNRLKPEEADHSEGGESAPLREMQEAENLPRPPEDDAK